MVSGWKQGMAGALMLVSATVMAAERSSAFDAQVMLERAVEAMQQSPEGALAAFNDQSGAFYQNDLYAFVIDMKGNYKATGANPALVGSNIANLKDAAGKPVGQSILKVAETLGEGVVEYEWLNRATNAVEHKITRIRRVGDSVVGVGFYLPSDS